MNVVLLLWKIYSKITNSTASTAIIHRTLSSIVSYINQHLTFIGMSNPQIQVTSSLVSLPKKNGYLNFVQAWRRAYTGPQQAPQDMVRQAASVWRNMAAEDRAPFLELAEQGRIQRLAAPRRRSKRLQEKRMREAAAARSRRTARHTYSSNISSEV